MPAMRPRLLALALLAAPIATSSGCCTMARLFCGPDRTPWISIDFRSPEHTTRTLLEALRRDDAEVVYACLSDAYRRRLRVDQMSIQLAWQKVRDQVPGLHLAGYAEVPEPTCRDRDHAFVAIDIEGHVMEVELVRECHWQVRYRTPPRDYRLGVELSPGRLVESLDGMADIEPVPTGEDDLDERSRLTLRPLEFAHSVELVPLEDIDFAGIFREWKVLDVRQRDGSEG